MGAAFDAMCENEGLQSRIASKNRQIREQKKLIIELAEGIVKYVDLGNGYTAKETNEFYEKAMKILTKQTKKKKK